MAEIRLDGMDELLKKLQSLGDKAARVENQALREGAEVLRKSASEKAPRSNFKKDHLQDNIQMSKVKTKNGIKYVEVGPTKSDNGPFFYAKFIEYGTSKRPAQPFMYPALVENKDEVIEVMKRVMKGALGI